MSDTISLNFEPTRIYHVITHMVGTTATERTFQITELFDSSTDDGTLRLWVILQNMLDTSSLGAGLA